MGSANTVLSGVLLVAGIIIFLVMGRKSLRDTLSPYHFIALGFFYYFFIPSTIVSYEPWRNNTSIPFVWTWVICFIPYLVSIFAVPIRLTFLRKPIFRRVFSPDSISPMLVLAAIPGNWFFALASKAAGGVEGGFAGQMLSLTAQGMHVLPLLAALGAQRFKGRLLQVGFVLLVAALLLVQVFLFEGAERRTVIRVVLFAMLGIHFYITKVSYKVIFTMMLCAIPLIYWLRVEQAAKAWYSAGVEELSIEDFKEIETRWRDSHEGNLFSAFLASSDNAIAYDNTMLIVEHIGVSRYVWGVSYARVLVSLIPRSIWPSKPVSLISRIRHEMPTSSKSPHQSISILGEAWWNFGLAGLIIVPFFLAGLLKGFYVISSGSMVERVRPSAIYCVVAPYYLENFRGGFGQIALTMFAAIFFMVVFAILSGRIGRRKKH